MAPAAAPVNAGDIEPPRRVAIAAGGGVVRHRRDDGGWEVQLHLADGTNGLLAALDLGEAARIAARILTLATLPVGACPA